MAREWLLAAVLAGALAGCGGDPPPPPVQELPLEMFCPAYAQGLCMGRVRCGCTTDMDACVRDTTADCPLAMGRARRTAVDEGLLVYDGQAATLAGMELVDAACDLSDAGITPYDTIQLGMFGVLTGTLEPGASCVPDQQACRRGRCELDRCLGFSVEGEPCDVDPAMPMVNRICVPEVAGDPAPEQRLRCAPDAPGGPTGRCLLLLADGVTCAANADCLSDRCAGTCMAKAADGLACTEDASCQSANCDFSTGRCARPRRDGDLCEEGASCASGYCDRDMKLAAGMCVARGAAGEPCEENAQCLSRFCTGSRACAEALCGL